MVTKNPRLNVVLDPDLYAEIRKLAERQGISLSLMARDLLKETMERYEDSYWEKVAHKRDQDLASQKPLSHKDTWS